MKKFLIASALLLMACASQQASAGPPNTLCNAGNTDCATVTNSKLDVNATATIGGFISSTSGSRMTPITVGTSDSSGTLPTGGTVVVTNAGATLMYCNARGVTATASDQPIAASGGWFPFTISGGITTLHCISTGSGTTANGLGGDGIPTGTGGGGGSGGGAVTVANGANVVEGTTTDAKVCTDATGTIQQYMRCLASNSANTLPVIASGVSTAVIGCDKSIVYDASTNGATQLVALASSQVIYVCGYTIHAQAAVNVELDYGTGTACATGNNKVTPAFQLTAFDGVVDGSPFYRGLKAIASNELCIKTSGGVAVQAVVYYTQY